MEQGGSPGHCPFTCWTAASRPAQGFACWKLLVTRSQFTRQCQGRRLSHAVSAWGEAWARWGTCHLESLESPIPPLLFFQRRTLNAISRHQVYRANQSRQVSIQSKLNCGTHCHQLLLRPEVKTNLWRERKSIGIIKQKDTVCDWGTPNHTTASGKGLCYVCLFSYIFPPACTPGQS